MLNNAAAYLLDRHLEASRDDRVALLADGCRLTYREVWSRSVRAAGTFRSEGIGTGDRVLLLLPDAPAFVAAFFGLIRLGAVPVPLNQRLPTRDWARVVEDCSPSGAVVSAGDLPRFAEVPARPRVWSERDLERGTPHEPIHDSGGDDIALILYTSGTTGRPKGAVHVHRGLCRTHDGVEPPYALFDGDISLCTAPLSFAYGLRDGLLHPFATGTTAALGSGPRLPHLIIARVLDQRPTMLFGTPRVLADILAIAESRPEVAFTSVRCCASCGERLPKQLRSRWGTRFGVELLDMVGSTEALRPFLVSEPGRAGLRPARGCTVELRSGRVWLRSPSNAVRYWNNEAESEATMVGGWLQTGDIAKQGPDGGLTLEGRVDEVVKVQGQKVVTGEIRDCLLQHPAVVDCAVLAVSAAATLTTIVAYVEARTAEAGLPLELRRWCRSRLAAHMVPEQILLVDELPRTGTGKVARGALQERLRHGV